MTITTDIAQWLHDVSIGDVPADARERATYAIADTVASIFAGRDEPVTDVAATYVAAQGALPRASQLASSARWSIEGAAFVNGVGAHALDFDDVSNTATAHPSAVVVPAIAAVGESLDVSGADLLEAYLVGVELIARLGSVIGSEHYRRGWHATSTLGALGAAAAVGKLTRLPIEQLQHVLAIATSLAGGSRQNFGSMTKPFHVGSTARAGVVAATLASLGMTGDADAVGGPSGFFALFGYGQSREADLVARLGRPWDIVETGLTVKKYPCCFATHRGIDAALDLRRATGFDPASVVEVRVLVAGDGLRPLLRRPARTTDEAKFSLEYVVTASLLDGEVSPKSFTPDNVARIEHSSLRRLVGVTEVLSEPVQGNPILDGHMEVVVRFGDGRRETRRVQRPRGGPGAPLSADELSAKFRGCVDPVVGADRAAAALTQLLALEQAASVAGLIRNHLVVDRPV